MVQTIRHQGSLRLIWRMLGRDSARFAAGASCCRILRQRAGYRAGSDRVRSCGDFRFQSYGGGCAAIDHRGRIRPVLDLASPGSTALPRKPPAVVGVDGKSAALCAGRRRPEKAGLRRHRRNSGMPAGSPRKPVRAALPCCAATRAMPRERSCRAGHAHAFRG